MSRHASCDGPYGSHSAVKISSIFNPFGRGGLTGVYGPLIFCEMEKPFSERLWWSHPVSR